MDIELLDALTVIILYGFIYIVEGNYNKKSQELSYPSDTTVDYALALENFYNNPLVSKGEPGAPYEYFDYLQHDYVDTNTIGIESNRIAKSFNSKDYRLSENLQNINRRNSGKGLESIQGDNGYEKNKKGILQGIIIPPAKVF